jgi:GDP-L-fucose synthase
MSEFDAFHHKRCVVTGGTGMIGRQVVRLLKEAGAWVVSVSLDNLELRQDVRYWHADLTQYVNCLDMTEHADYVFHVAGIKGGVVVTRTKPASFFVPLLQMNTNVLEACRVNGVKNVVYVSSIGAYASARVFREDDSHEGETMDAFPGWAKRMGERQIDAYNIQYGIDWSVVRPCNVYGPGDNFDPDTAMVIPALISKIARGDDPVVVWGDGRAIRDFCYSEDVARGILCAALSDDRGLFNLASGQGYAIADLVAALHKVADFRHEWDTSKPAGHPQRVMDITKARRELGWSPRVSLVEGLRRTWAWYREHSDEHKRKVDYFADVA